MIILLGFGKKCLTIIDLVIRDKRTNKTKGYGFVSFKDPADFTKAIKVSLLVLRTLKN